MASGSASEETLHKRVFIKNSTPIGECPPAQQSVAQPPKDVGDALASDSDSNSSRPRRLKGGTGNNTWALYDDQVHRERVSSFISVNIEIPDAKRIRPTQTISGYEEEVLNDKGFSRSSHVSQFYAVILVLIGVAYPVTEALREEWLIDHYAAAFLTYLFSMSSIFILHCEMYDTILKRRHNREKCKQHEEIPPQEGADNAGMDQDKTSEIAEDPDLPGEGATTSEVFNYISLHSGTATLADEGTSIFMKGGALIFAMANMVYVALRIEGAHQRRSCGLDTIIYPHYVHMIFIVLQTFMIFKECKFVLRKNKPLIRFGLQHILATNVCVWVRFLVIEVAEQLMHQRQVDTPVNSSDVNSSNRCPYNPIMYKAAPYLFPFILEYSLVAMSTMAFLFSAVNVRVSKELYKAVTASLQRKRLSRAREIYKESEKHTPGTSSESCKGLYLGIVVLAAVIVSMILFFNWDDKNDSRKSEMVYQIAKIALFGLLLITSIMGLTIFRKFIFDVNQSNSLDHMLLALSLTFSVMLNVFIIFCMVNVDKEGPDTISILTLTASSLSIIQSVAQTFLIIDGMQRVAATQEQIVHKHGRGVTTFLIITNISVWLVQSFEAKRADNVIEQEYFGDVAWAIIHSIALPVMLFFRFHSSICLAHMWKHCYHQEEDQHWLRQGIKVHIDVRKG